MSRSWKINWGAVALAALCLSAMAGCVSAPNSGIDPTGEHVFAASSEQNPANQRYYDEPMGRLPWDGTVVLLSSPGQVAMVGSEVILAAGVGAADGYLRTNRRLEWTLSAGSVGQFTAVGKGGFTDLLVGDFNRPRKVSNSFAIGSTGRGNVRLNRGTPSPDDDLLVTRGQGWVSLMSPVEGTSRVTVLAPDVYDWNCRTRSIAIHWVDAEWQFPTPSINPAGSSHLLTTTVLRCSDQSPREGWLVRYTIAGGPPAGFAPDGAPTVEAPVDATGRANAEIVQLQPAHGTNQICIEIIRPGNVPSAEGRLVVARGSTSKTWSAPDLAINMTGPASANVGEPVTYRIDVSNPGDLPANDVSVELDVLAGMEFVDSSQAVEHLGDKLLWRIGQLGARQQATIEVRLQAQKQGQATNCCRATAADGLSASGCTTTTFGQAAALDVRMTGPEQVAIGEEVYFEIVITNNGQTMAADLTISDRLDPGLELKADRGKTCIRRNLGNLSPGQSERLGVTLLVTAAGRLCHTVEVTGPTVALASAQACLTAVAQPGAAPPPADDWRQAEPLPGAAVPLRLDIVGPVKHTVGENARFTIDLSNNGDATLYDLKVVNSFDRSLRPVLASGGYQIENGAMTWTVDSLPPGQTRQFEIHYQCEAAAVQAGCRAMVELPDGRRAEDEAFLEITRTPEAEAPPPAIMPEITPPTDALDLTVVGLRNPVATGKELTYDVRVVNRGTLPYRQLSLTAIAPEGMTPNPLGTSPPERFRIDGQVVYFDAIDELPAGETLTFRIRVRTSVAGQCRFRVELTSPMLSEPLAAEALTEVFLDRDR